MLSTIRRERIKSIREESLAGTGSSAGKRGARAEELVTHLLDVHETARVAVARQLHDEMGSFLVSAAMDLAWAETHIDADPGMLKRLQRIRAHLRSAIDVKRALTEELRPTLLDNFGLFAACRWHLKNLETDSSIRRTERYPTEELPLASAALTHLFRIVEALLNMTARTPHVRAIDLTMVVNEAVLRVSISHESGMPPIIGDAGSEREEMAIVLHRVRLLQAELESTYSELGARHQVAVPLRAILVG